MKHFKIETVTAFFNVSSKPLSQDTLVTRSELNSIQ